MPHETARVTSVYFFAYTLDAFGVAAELAAQVGVDVWNFTSPTGSSLGAAFQYALPHLRTAFEAWPHPNAGEFKEFYFERPFLMAHRRGLDIPERQQLPAWAKFVHPGR